MRKYYVSFPSDLVVILLGSVPGTFKIINRFFTNDLGNWKFGDFLINTQVMVFGFFSWSKSLDSLKISYLNVGKRSLLFIFTNYILLPNHEIILHRFAERTFSKEPNSYFSGCGIPDVSFLQYGILKLLNSLLHLTI